MIQTIFWSNLSFISKFETRYNHIFQNSRGRKKNRLENSYATLDLAAHFSTSANVPSTALERLERVDKDETRGGWPCHKFELPRALRPEKEAFHASNSPRRFARFRFLAPQPAQSRSPSPPFSFPSPDAANRRSFISERTWKFRFADHAPRTRNFLSHIRTCRIGINSSRGGNWTLGMNFSDFYE